MIDRRVARRLDPASKPQGPGEAAQASPDLSAAWLPNVSRRLACWCGRDAATYDLGQSSEASIEIGIARSSVSVSASAQGSGIFRHLGRFSAFFRLFGGILDPTDSD